MAEADKTAPPEVWGVQEDQYRAWRRHPATRAFLHYLADMRDLARRDHVSRWEAGQGDDPIYERQELGQVIMLTHLIGLEFEHMANFYQENPDVSGLNEDEAVADEAG